MTEGTGSDTEPLASRELFPVHRMAAEVATFMRTLDGVSITLMWACIAVARALPHFVGNADVSDPLVAVVALPLLVIVPRQLGILLRPLAGILVGGWQVQLDAVEAYVVAWLAGIWLLVIGLAILTGVLGVPAAVGGAVVLLVASASGLVFALRTAAEGERQTAWHFSNLLREAWPFAVAVVLISAPLALIRLNQPYPLLVGWGQFNYNYRVLQFVESDHISIAPGLHTPIHAALLGVSRVVTGAESEGLIWAAPILFYLAYGLGVFLFARRILGSNLLALMTLWVALWVLSLSTFQHLHGVGMRGVILAIWPWILLLLHRHMPAMEGRRYGAALHVLAAIGGVASVAVIRWFFPSPLQIWALLVLAFVFLVLVRSVDERMRHSVGLVAFAACSLTFVHFIEGPLFIGLGLAFLLMLSWKPVSVWWRVFLGAGFGATAVFIALQAGGDLTFDDPSVISRLLLGNARADAIPIPFDDKLDLLTRGLTYTVLSLLALSAVRVLFWPNTTHLAAMVAVGLAILLYFVPESGLHRALGPVIPLVGLSVALELQWYARRLLDFRWRQPSVLWSGALVVAAMIALTPELTSSLRSQMTLSSHLGFPSPMGERIFSNITPDEYRASEWIADHAPPDWAIISDPITMFFMEGLTFHPQVAEKRVWVAESEYSEEDRERLRSLDPTVFRAPTLEEAVARMELLTGDHPGFVLVISQRTLDWFLNPSDLFRRAKPRDRLELDADPLNSLCGYYEIEPCVSRFFEGDRFSVVYSNPGVAVLVLRRELGDFLPSRGSLGMNPARPK